MTLGKRLLLSLVASIGLSILLFLLERATNSKTLFLLQIPGLYASIGMWGVHSGPDNPAVGVIVFGGADALAYWPITFGLSYLLKRRRSPPHDS